MGDPFEAARAHGAATVRRILEDAPWGGETYKLFYNVNFPPVPAAKVRGMAAVAQGYRRRRADGRARAGCRRRAGATCGSAGSAQGEPTQPGTDVTANVDGWISVTPMRCDLTDHGALGTLRDVFADAGS